MRNHTIHDQNLNRILQRPGLIGLEGVVMSGTINLFDKNGQLLGQPDGVFFHDNHHITIVEYKGRDTKENEARARQQLNVAYPRLARYFKKFPEKLYVYKKGDLYCVERQK